MNNDNINAEEYLIKWIKARRFDIDGRIKFYSIKEIEYNCANIPLAFFIELNKSINPDEKQNYTLLGVLKRKTNWADLAYTSYFNLFFGNDNSMKIIDNMTKEIYRKRGIGSSALDILKEIAYQNNCTKIFGNRIPIPNTDKSRKDLWSFYDKNGFTQWEDKNYIEFDMANY